MPIIENKPIKLTETQNIKFNTVSVTKDTLKVDGSLMAIVTFDVIGDSELTVSEMKLIYRGEEFNTFWANFNSGKFLYDELKLQKELEATVTNEVENDFINIIN